MSETPAAPAQFERSPLELGAGGTLACALACLARGRSEILALTAVVAACATVDLATLAIWLDIDNEAYGKALATAFVWSFFALVVLGLALAVPKGEGVAFILYTAAFASAVAGALIATWLVLTSGDEDGLRVADLPVPVGDDALLQLLGALLVLLAAFWFGALAASRLEAQTLKRTLSTSPSATT